MKRCRESEECESLPAHASTSLESKEECQSDCKKLGNGIVLLSNWVGENVQVNLAMEIRKLGDSVHGFYDCNNERFIH